MVCSFSSTVLRISSSLAALVCCIVASWVSSVPRTSASRRALASLNACSCDASVSDSVFCISVSCCEKASIWAFWVRVASWPWRVRVS